MRTFRTAVVVALSVVALIAAAPARAVSNRIFLSTNGNNANDCANPLTPCLTFAGAMAQVNAGGEVIAEATGGYGALNVTQAVTISGPPGVVIYSGLSVTVNAPAATVVLRGLTIDGAGALANGINVVAVGTLLIEGCVVANFAGNSVGQGNGIQFGGDGNVFVKDSTIRGNGSAGLRGSSPATAARYSIDSCRIEGNLFGVISNSLTFMTLRDTVIAGNSFAGIVAAGEMNLESCLVTQNQFGVQAMFATAVVRLSNTTVTDNLSGLSFSQNAILLSRQNNTVEKNNGMDGAFSGTFSAK